MIFKRAARLRHGQDIGNNLKVGGSNQPPQPTFVFVVPYLDRK
jgi:hypothetical protein